MSSFMLSVQDLVVTYNRHSDGPVLKNVNFQIASEEKVVIVGPNGSGKSTLLKAILGLAPIESGSVKVFGTDVKEVRGDVRVSTNLAEVYRLAYVKAKDVVKIFAELKGGNPDSAFKMFGNILAVSFSPKLVLLDEPFDNVDEGRRRRFIEVLRQLPAEMVVITHEFNLLQRLSDWGLYFMIEGRLWGKFSASLLDRLYITRGEASGSLAVMETSLGRLSITLDHGDIAVRTATNLNALLEQV